jgi:D-glycero-D-manno-heptose 1,7-bisphosphate phosphatase
MVSAIFLDRDGVIIENRDHYVRSWQDVEFLPGALPALARARGSSYKFVMVTNQSAVGRGILTHSLAAAINDQVLFEIERCGGRIDAAYICPHAPRDNCECRKPKPGLLLQAARELHIDLASSVMIGDAVTDLQAGQAAGVGQRILVLTGRGTRQARLPGAQLLEPFTEYPDLAAALASLIT